MELSPWVIAILVAAVAVRILVMVMSTKGPDCKCPRCFDAIPKDAPICKSCHTPLQWIGKDAYATPQRERSTCPECGANFAKAPVCPICRAPQT